MQYISISLPSFSNLSDTLLQLITIKNGPKVQFNFFKGTSGGGFITPHMVVEQVWRVHSELFLCFLVMACVLYSYVSVFKSQHLAISY